jgi:hypothetical protein
LSASGTITCSNVAASLSARPPETMILALVSSGRSLCELERDEARQAGIAGPETASTRPSRRSAGLVERGAAHGHDQLGVASFDRGDGVAGVDRAVKVSPRPRGCRELHHVEQRGDARGDVLAGGGGGATNAS